MRPWTEVTDTGDVASDMCTCVVALLARYSGGAALPPIALVDMERVGPAPELHSAITFTLPHSGQRLLDMPLNKLSQEIPTMEQQRVARAKVGGARVRVHVLGLHPEPPG